MRLRELLVVLTLAGCGGSVEEPKIVPVPAPVPRPVPAPPPVVPPVPAPSPPPPPVQVEGIAHVSWVDPPEKEFLAGVYVYYGQVSQNLQTRIFVNPGQQELVVGNLEKGKLYFFAASSLGTNGAESEKTEEVPFTP